MSNQINTSILAKTRSSGTDLWHRFTVKVVRSDVVQAVSER